MDKRKLLQLTGKTVRETLMRRHGKISVWSAKGEIFLKKDTQNAPRVTVCSEKDLHDIVHGLISLDAEPEDEADNQRRLLHKTHQTKPNQTKPNTSHF